MAVDQGVAPTTQALRAGNELRQLSDELMLGDVAGRTGPDVQEPGVGCQFDHDRAELVSASRARLRTLERMLAVMPHHKGTDHLRAELRTRMAKVGQELSRQHAGAQYRSVRCASRRRWSGRPDRST